MALTRRMLKAMGIEGEAIDQIIDAHAETVDALKEERDSYKDKAEQAESLGKELEETREQLKAAQEDGENASKSNKEQSDELAKLREANEKLKGEYDAYKSDVESERSMRAKRDAYRALIEKAGIAPKYVGAVLKVANLSEVELDDDGGVKDAKKAIDGLKADYPEFIAKTETVGAHTETPPAGNQTSSGVSERAKRVIAQHNERYGIKTDKE